MSVVPRYQTSFARIAAAVVDTIVLIPLGLLDETLLSPSRPPWVVIVWASITYSSYWIYSTLLHARYGQTVGKRLLRIKVLDVQELRIPTLKQALLRDVGLIGFNILALTYLIYLVLIGEYSPGAEITNVPGQILAYASLGWFALEIMSMFANSKRRAVHDYIARTVVVSDA